MTGRASPWPIAVVTGMLGSGKTTMISRLLRHPAMADTLVLVNEFGAIGLDHDLIKAVTDCVVLLPNGCLCCTMRDDIVQSLRDLGRAWLAGTIPDFGRVLIETTGLAEPAPLVASLTSHPLIADSFALQTIVTVVDGAFALRQLVGNVTCRNQIVLADRLMVSKTDIVGSLELDQLSVRLRAYNALATIAASHDPHPDMVFDRAGSRAPRISVVCDAPGDHLADVSMVLLKPSRSLGWTPFRIWLGGVLDTFGPRLLRLKGRLTFDSMPTSVVIQAVHHTFYPVVEAPNGPAGRAEDFLVLIFDGPAPSELGARCKEAGFARC